MRFKQFLESQSNFPQILGQATSEQELINLVRQFSPEQKQQLLDWVKEINRQHYAKLIGTSHPVLLHHGSPAEKIGDEGLKAVQGQRSLGFIPGATYPVQNQGVFLTDSKSLAHYFGSNRSKYGRDYQVYDVYANLDHVLNASNPLTLPLSLRKLGLSLVNNYEGTRKARLAQADIWWLLDRPEFVEAIRSLGFTSIKFRESRGILKQAGDAAGFTYLMLDPKQMVVVNNRNNLIKTLGDVLKYLHSA